MFLYFNFWNELCVYLYEVCLCDLECKAMDVYLYYHEYKDLDSIRTYKVFPLSLLDVTWIVSNQGSVPPSLVAVNS